MKRSNRLLSLSVLILSSAEFCAHGSAFFSIIENPEGVYSPENFAMDISADGSTVVGVVSSFRIAFYWQRNLGMQLISYDPFDGGYDSVAYGVSDDGTRIVGAIAPSGYLIRGESAATGWSVVGGSVVEEWYHPYYSGYNGISGNGEVRVGFVGTGRYAPRMAYVSSVGQLDIPDEWSQSDWDTFEAKAASYDGSIVVGSGSYGGFVWTQETGMQPFVMDRPWGISSDGRVIVGDNFSNATRWTEEGGMVVLSPGIAYDVSSSGNVVVGRHGNWDSGRAFVWTEDLGVLFIDDMLIAAGLDLEGLNLTVARAVAEVGDWVTVVGYGVNLDGYTQSYVATFLIPEPAAYGALLGLAVMALALGRRKGKRR